MKFRHLLMTIIFIVIISPLSSQNWQEGWPGGNLTCTVTTSPTGRPGQVNTTYSNYVWTDPSGGVHAFPSDARSREFWQRKSGQIPRGGTPEYELVGVPVDTLSNDGFYRFRGIHLNGQITAYGDVYPKYRLLSVIYAPPGRQSSVTYGVGSSMGTKTSVSDSANRSFGLNLQLGAKDSFVGGSLGAGWKQTVEDFYYISLTNNENQSQTFPGPLNSMKGLDHDFDAFVLWLNPRIAVAATGGTTGTWSYGNDPRDPAGAYGQQMDTVVVYVKWLKNIDLMLTEAPGVWSALQRTWAGANGAFTGQDAASLLGRNPFWNGQGPIDLKRYELLRNQVVLYQPPPSGGQPFTDNYEIGRQITSTEGRNVTDSHSVSVQISGGIYPIFKVTASGSWEWVHKVSKEHSQSDTKFARAVITGPPAIDENGNVYTGPVRFQVYKDNLWGTFMFAPAD